MQLALLDNGNCSSSSTMFEEKVPSRNRDLSQRQNSEIMHSENRPQSLDDPTIDSNYSDHSGIQVIPTLKIFSADFWYGLLLKYIDTQKIMGYSKMYHIYNSVMRHNIHFKSMTSVYIGCFTGQICYSRVNCNLVQ